MLNNIKIRAFTLLEVIIATTLLITTLVSIYRVSNSAQNVIISTENRVTALYLAEEGLEFMRNRRDTYISKSWNKKNGWDEYLKNIFGNRANLMEKLIVTKKIENIDGLYELGNNPIEDKNISSVDDICTISFDNCMYEKIAILKEDYKKNGIKIPKDYFRKIVIKKDAGENNIIKIESVIYWDNRGELQRFSLDFKLANIAIY